MMRIICDKRRVDATLKAYTQQVEPSMSNTYLTTDALAERIHYDPRTIRDRLKDSVLIEAKHYFRPFGGRKILYIWEAIERDMMGKSVAAESSPIAMADGGLCDSYRNSMWPRASEQKTSTNQTAGIPMASGGVCNG